LRSPRENTSTLQIGSNAAQLDVHLAEQALVVGAEFDADYYLAIAPRVAHAGVDPLSHFMTAGWREGLNPNGSFSVSEYLEDNPDVAAAGMNPFYHYIAHGRAEGRLLRLGYDYRHGIVAEPLSVAQRLASRPPVPETSVGSGGQLLRALRAPSRSGYRKLHVSVSHDDFTTNVGGVQSCLVREAAAFERAGVDHIHLFPARPLLVTDHENENPPSGVLVNGTPAGIFESRSISEVFEKAIGAEAPLRSFAIHSLLGHNVRALTSILRVLGMSRGFFWIHDFASVCAGHNLLRNDLEFCGAPAVDSAACNLCLYGERRRTQIADHQDLFAAFEMTAVAPSQVAMDIWKAATPLEARDERIHPHCRFVPRLRVVPAPRPAQGGSKPLRVAYLGFPDVHKGWMTYRDLAISFAADERYAFHHLGACWQRGLPIAFEEVVVDPEKPVAMTAAVEAHAIDVAVIWSLCQETFSFVAHEALAGGAAIVTSGASGNITRLVEMTGQGRILPDTQALHKLFASGAALELARARRGEWIFSLEYGGMTADLMAGML